MNKNNLAEKVFCKDIAKLSPSYCLSSSYVSCKSSLSFSSTSSQTTTTEISGSSSSFCFSCSCFQRPHHRQAQVYLPVHAPFCHTRPQLTNSTDLNSASADQLGATKWHYNHLPVHPPVHPPMQNFEIQFKPILTLCQQLYGPVIATLGPN